MATTITTDELDLFDLFKSNSKSAEENGTWMELNADTGFKIRALHSKIVTDKREELMKPFQMMIRSGAKLPDEKNEEIGLRVIASAVLADWKGIKNADKKLVKYSEDEAYAILKALPKMASAILNWSTESANYQDELVEDNAKNS